MWLASEITTGDTLKSLFEPFDGDFNCTVMAPKMNSSRDERMEIWKPLEKRPRL